MLAPAPFRAAAARLLARVCRKLVDQVLAMRDISVEETEAIRELLRAVVECDALTGANLNNKIRFTGIGWKIVSKKMLTHSLV